MDRRWAVLALVCASTTSTALLDQGLPTLFAFLQADFQLSRAEVGLYISAAEIGTVVTFILGGWAADAVGIRRVLPAVQAVLGLICAAFALAPTYRQGLATLFVYGLAFGVSSPSVSLAVLYWFPARTRATAMGLRQTGVALAGIAAAALLPSFALAFGWRTGLLCISVAIFTSAVAMLWYRDPPDARPIGIVARPSWSQIRPLIRNRDQLVVNAYAMILFANQYAISGYLILYLRDYLESTVVAGGLVLAVAQGGALCGRILWGILSDRTFRGRRAPGLQVAGGIAAALLIALALLPPGVSLWLLAPLAFGLGFSAMGWHALRQVLLLELVPRAIAGVALGVSQTLSEAGPVLGPPLFGALADWAGYRVAWLVMAGLTAFVSLVLMRAVDERRAAAVSPATEPRPLTAPTTRIRTERKKL